MKHNQIVIALGAALFITGIGFIHVASPLEGNQAAAYPMDQRSDTSSYGMMKSGHHAAGTISNIQNDESRNPAWILSGYPSCQPPSVLALYT